MEKVAPGKYRGVLATPAKRFVGYFIEVTDNDPQTVPGIITTGFQEILPATRGEGQ